MSATALSRAYPIRLEAIPMMGDQIKKTVERFFDNSLENIGRGNSVSWNTKRVNRGQADPKIVDIPRSKMGSSCYCPVEDVQR